MRRMVQAAGLTPGAVFWGEGRNTGKQGLDRKIPGYRAGAAHGRLVFVLRDLDTDAGCAPALLMQLGGETGDNLCLRIVVRTTDAWPLADREALALHLGVDPQRLPADCEAVPSPKAAIVDAARKSRSRRVREALLPREGSGRAEGPEYATVMDAFIREEWDPMRAAGNSASLERALCGLQALAGRVKAAGAG